MATSKSRSFCMVLPFGFRCPAAPGHGHLEIRLGRHRRDERPSLRTQSHAEFDPDLIWRVLDRPEPGDQATGSRGNCRSGVLKSFIGLLHESGAILPQPAHYRAGGRLVDFNQDAATLVELEFDKT